MSTLLNDFPGVLSDCKAGAEAIESIGKMLTSFNSFWDFTYDVGESIIVNGANIFDEVKAAVSNYESGNYLSTGYEVG